MMTPVVNSENTMTDRKYRMSRESSIQKGVLDSRDILYFLSVIVFSLFTTGVIIRAHRAG